MQNIIESMSTEEFNSLAGEEFLGCVYIDKDNTPVILPADDPNQMSFSIPSNAKRYMWRLKNIQSSQIMIIQPAVSAMNLSVK